MTTTTMQTMALTRCAHVQSADGEDKE
jgi:hypothetical protein